MDTSFIKQDYADLSAMTFDGDIIDIPNQVLRKPISYEDQNKLNDNSICIVSNYKFLSDPVPKWSDKIKAICHPFRETSVCDPLKAISLFPEKVVAFHYYHLQIHFAEQSLHTYFLERNILPLAPHLFLKVAHFLLIALIG